MENVAVKIICPFSDDIEWRELPVLKDSDFPLDVFDQRTIEFADSLSKNILQHKEFGRVPALAALGFWLRKSNISRIIKENDSLFANQKVKVLPLGKVLHICPSNVDTIFVYSLFISLLAGNKNILRVSSKLQPAFLNFLFDTLNSLFSADKFKIFANYINIITYPHNDEISSALSKNVDGRIVWGGDATASIFRALPTNPRSRDIFFSDRLSFAVIKSSMFTEMSEDVKLETVRKFYNDSYTFDQKGCSSPQQVYFLGDNDTSKKAEKTFFDLLDQIARMNYEYDEASLSTLKFNELVNNSLNNGIENIKYRTAYTYNVELKKGKIEHTCGGGYFSSSNINNLNELRDEINSQIQTVSYFGLDSNELAALVEIAKGRGIDRIVPMGKALDFDYIWDGYNLISALTKSLHVI